MASDPIIPQQTNKDVKSAWICCFHSLIHECRWIIHGYDVSRRQRRRTSEGSVPLFSRCINLRRPPREDDLSAEMSRWPSRFTRLLSARCECGPLRIIRLSISYWPLTWDTNTLNADAGLSSLRPAAFQHIRSPKAGEKTLHVSFSAGEHKTIYRSIYLIFVFWFLSGFMGKCTFSKIVTFYRT